MAHPNVGGLQIEPGATLGPALTPKRNESFWWRWGPAAAVLVAVAFAVGAVLNRGHLTTMVAPSATVVLADVENLTSDSSLGNALTIAATVALQQSSRFTQYPRNRLADALKRMGRPPDARLTEELAVQLAQREAGQAVVAISVSSLGTGYLLAGRLIDPTTGSVLAANREKAASADALLDGLDKMVGWVRRELGDRAWRDATPLPQVTTASLPALRAYAAAQQALFSGAYAEVPPAIERALAADTGFAAAQRLLGSYLIFVNDEPNGLRWLREANARRDRLTEYERLSLARGLASAEGRKQDAVTAAGTLATLYPSVWSWVGYGEELRETGADVEAINAYQRALAIDSNFVWAHLGVALTRNHQRDFRGAAAAYALTWRADSTVLLRDFYNQQWGGVYVKMQEWARAESVFTKMLSRDLNSRSRGLRALAYLSLYRGRYREAVDYLEKGIATYSGPSLSLYRDLVLLADVQLSQGDAPAANRALDRALEIVRAKPMAPGFLALGGYQMVRAGRLADAKLILDSLAARATLRPNSDLDQGALAILRADLAFAKGDASGALGMLVEKRLKPFSSIGNLIRAKAFAQENHIDSALAVAKAIGEDINFGIEGMQDGFRSMVLVAELYERAGDFASARDAWATFAHAWSTGDDDLPALQRARSRIRELSAVLARAESKRAASEAVEANRAGRGGSGRASARCQWTLLPDRWCRMAS